MKIIKIINDREKTYFLFVDPFPKELSKADYLIIYLYDWGVKGELLITNNTVQEVIDSENISTYAGRYHYAKTLTENSIKFSELPKQVIDLYEKYSFSFRSKE